MNEGRKANILFVSISTILFAAIHWEGGLGKVAATGIVGFSAAVYFVKNRSLWSLLTAHLTTDLVIGGVHELSSQNIFDEK